MIFYFFLRRYRKWPTVRYVEWWFMSDLGRFLQGDLRLEESQVPVLTMEQWLRKRYAGSTTSKRNINLDYSDTFKTHFLYLSDVIQSWGCLFKDSYFCTISAKTLEISIKTRVGKYLIDIQNGAMFVFSKARNAFTDSKSIY